MDGKELYRWLPAKSPGAKDPAGSWLPLWMHLEDTAGVMAYLVDRWLPRRIAPSMEGPHGAVDFRSAALFVALAHDIGKGTPCFLHIIAPHVADAAETLGSMGLGCPGRDQLTDPGMTRHPAAGQAYLVSEGVPDGLCAVVGAHHGVPTAGSAEWVFEGDLEQYDRNFFGPGYADSGVGRLWDAARRALLERALERSGCGSVADLPNPDRVPQVVMTGLLTMADWIASNTAYFPLIDQSSCGMESMYPARVEEAMGRLALPGPWEPTTFFLDAEGFAERFGFMPNAVQMAAVEVAMGADEPGIVIVEAPCGCGKTEAALAAAEVLASKAGCGGLAVCLPTQATANGILPRLLSWGETQSEGARHSVRLAHGAAMLNDTYRELAVASSAEGTADCLDSGLVVNEWLSGRRQSLLSDFVVSTVDQLLMSCLRARHCTLRHLGMAGKVVVVDECHAYDAYMGEYLRRVLSWLGSYGVPVVMLSATLPPAMRDGFLEAYTGRSPEAVESEGYPSITWSDGGDVHRFVVGEAGARREVRVERIDPDGLAAFLGEALAEGGVAGVVLNTVSRAQEVAAHIAEALPDVEVELFHSRFTAYDRARREARLMERIGKGPRRGVRASGLVVVGTQVLEQSLDIDFDVMATDLAPVDLMVQRVGRLHRHDRARPVPVSEPVLAVMGAEGEPDRGSLAVYGRWPLMRAAEVLPDTLALPDDVPGIVAEAYRDPLSEELGGVRAEAWGELREAIDRERRRADTFLLEVPGDWPPTIDGMLDTVLDVGENDAIASVRGGESSPTVLLMVDRRDGCMGFLPWVGGRDLERGRKPEGSDARLVASQKVALPPPFSRKGLRAAAVRELERRNAEALPVWQESGWIHGELVLALDGDLTCELCGYTLKYHHDAGLTYEREEGADGPDER